MASRHLRGFEAIREALDQSMARDSSVYVMGLGVPDPKGVFGTTAGLRERYGDERVMDMPASENGMTGVAIGSALAGMRPVMVHQRIDFAILAVEQIVNQAAKWHYMFNGKGTVPLVVRMVVGRGWGQGPQHSQSLHSWFAHVPGLKVVLPSTPYDLKGLLIASIEDDNPVVFIEHRWTYHVSGPVPEETYRVPLGTARVVREGNDVTIAAVSHMTLEALRAAAIVEPLGVSVEVVDVRTLRPLDRATIIESVRKTGRLLAADTSWKLAGYSAELVATVVEGAHDLLKAAPRRIALPDAPTPTSPALANAYYPRGLDLARAVMAMVGRSHEGLQLEPPSTTPLDVPDASFAGPF